MSHETSNAVRLWLCLPKSCPNSYIHAPTSAGGLGVPDFERFVPHNRQKRLPRLQSSPVPAVREAFLAHGQQILAGAARAVEKDRLKQSHAAALHASVDGSELKLCSENSASVAYMRAPQGIAGKEFKQYARIRINALPSRKRVNRGKNGPTMCRACKCRLRPLPISYKTAQGRMKVG